MSKCANENIIKTKKKDWVQESQMWADHLKKLIKIKLFHNENISQRKTNFWSLFLQEFLVSHSIKYSHRRAGMHMRRLHRLKVLWAVTYTTAMQPYLFHFVLYKSIAKSWTWNYVSHPSIHTDTDMPLHPINLLQCYQSYLVSTYSKSLLYPGH